MPQIQPVMMSSATPEQRKILEDITAKMGKVPNIYASIAHSPSTLEAVLAHGASLKKGVLTAKEIELISLAIGQNNDCGYCVAAHTFIGKMSGLSPQEMIDARKGLSQDKKTDALIKLAVEITSSKGHLSTETLRTFRSSGYSDAALVEVIAWVAHNTFTNYFNHIAATEIDFPIPPRIQ